MSIIELPPKIKNEDLFDVMINNPQKELSEVIDKINENYEYWDSVKYKKCPEGISSEKLWTYVKSSRMKNMISVWKKYDINLCVTNHMQRMCHEFDMNFGGSWGATSIISDENKELYLVSSLMEEAIFSSQMEGASTTRQVAKDMLRKKIAPKDKSQQMIANNYQTIQFVGYCENFLDGKIQP